MTLSPLRYLDDNIHDIRSEERFVGCYRGPESCRLHSYIRCQIRCQHSACPTGFSR